MEVKIVVVDDSPFSIAVLKDILTNGGFNVTGEASSLDETIEVVDRLRPDLVTMDMTIPGTDGLECTRAIHAIDPNIKVIIVSSMMDEEIVQKARKNNVSGYVQKPADPEELILLVNRIMASEELFLELEALYGTAFKESFSDTFNKLLKNVPEITVENACNTDQESRGISVVMGIIGKYIGRMIFDMSHDTAAKLAETMLRRPCKSSEEMLNVIGEFANIAAGNACSIINRKNKLFGLRVAPPTIFHGQSVHISKAELETATSITALTPNGEIYANIGFKRGAAEWMSNM